MHFFIINYKNGTTEIKHLAANSGNRYFEILLDCVSNPEIESYRKYIAEDVTFDDK